MRKRSKITTRLNSDIMIIAALQKLTLLDYPGKLSCIIFTQGCNFACGYCHNPEMIPTKRVLPYRSELEPEAIFDFLRRRKGLLDGVVISGGEPTIQPDLIDFITVIKALGFLVKLDTNGSHPGVLKKLLDLHLLDYIAMDVKHTLEKYRELVKNDCREQIRESIDIIKNSGITYEFRSTILPKYHTQDDLITMGSMVAGAKEWYLQQFRPLKTLDKSLKDERCFTRGELNKIQGKIGNSIKTEVRNDA